MPAKCENLECTKYPSFNTLGETKGKYCLAHKLTDMVDVRHKKCSHPGCDSQPIYNTIGETRGKYCVAHKLPDMVDVKNKRCCHPGCDSRPIYNTIGETKGKYCVAHKLPDMVDVKNKKCSHPGCNSQPFYNTIGETKGKYCVTHKLPDMVDVKNKKCSHPGCNSQPSYNIIGETKGKYCVAHKLQDMVDVVSKRCSHPCCDSQPFYNTICETKGKYCAAHKLPDMVDVKSKRCSHPCCDSHPAYNTIGETKGKYCLAHKLPDMVNVISKRCSHPCCDSLPSYNTIGETKGKYCLAHKLPDMVNVISKRCEFTGCKTHATYGKPGIKPTHCAKHKITGMIFKPTTICKDCKELAIFGIKQKLIHCEAHKQPNEINLSERECVSCHLMYVLDADNKCENCNPESFARAVLAKQSALMAFLDAQRHLGTTVDDSMIDSGICGKERPDRIIDLYDKVLVIECDENQHKERPCLCEQTRMVNIGQSFGGIPVYFIRWNPDSFKTPKHKQESLKRRYEILCEFLNAIKDGRHQLPKIGLVSAIYMFYDGWTGVENLAPENWTVIGASFSITTSI